VAKVISEDITRFYHQYPRIPVVVTAQANGRRNAMTAAWNTPISYSPPLYAIAISTDRFTYQLIVDSKEFGVNLLPFEEAELVDAIGSTTGREVDKFQRFSIAIDKPVETAVPILEAAYAAYECRLIDDRGYGDHRLLMGEIVAIHMLQDLRDPSVSQEIPNLRKVTPLLYLGRQHYLTVAKETVKYVPR